MLLFNSSGRHLGTQTSEREEGQMERGNHTGTGESTHDRGDGFDLLRAIRCLYGGGALRSTRESGDVTTTPLIAR